MPDDEVTIAYCHACGGPMNVVSVAPFSNVECPQCGKHTRVKREFGPYTLLRRHAIGGMSVVFVAHDNTLDREVALKILNEDYSADERRISAFVEEARLTASVTHPHVVRLLTTGRAFDRFYIAMELVTGGHLEHQIRERGALPELEMLPLATQVAEGLQAAHAAGLIHRDVKPGNILLDAAGNAKIVDFGLALVTKGGTAQATELWATPYYVPPETIEGLVEDFRSDIYAFGATLYHALAGHPSCAEETMDTLKLREAKQHITPLCQVAPWLTAETCAVVERAMSYHPVDRYGSYDEMLAALRTAQQRAMAGPSESAPDTATLRRRRAAKQRERSILIGAAALVLVATGFVIFSLTHKKPGKVPNTIVNSQSLEAIPEVDPGSIKDPAAAARIGQRYKSAREAMEKRDFSRAVKEFSALRDDPEVQEPTGTWAGVEAVMAAYLDGHARDARQQADLSAKHATAANLSNPNVVNKLVPALQQIRELPSITPKDLNPSKADGAVSMAWMLCGMKNWEQGRLDQAAEFFKAVEAVSLTEADAWARHYQKLSHQYLADYKRLADAELKDLPADKSTCQKKIDELDKVHGSLETLGRARFNVREWQLALKRHIRDLDKGGNSSATFAATRPEVERMSKECLFAEAATSLKALKVKPEEKEARDALTLLVESAASLLSSLEDDLRRGEIVVDLKSRDGASTYSKVATGAPGKIQVTDASGTAREIEWKDLSPDSIIDLHRALVKAVKPEEVLQRHESAIAFQWLAGDRERAKAAAERLAQENPGFKQRWEAMTPGMK